MIIAKPLSKQSEIQNKTASEINKNTDIRKQLNSLKLEAFINIFGNDLIHSNIPVIYLERWSTVSNRKSNYFLSIYNELKKIKTPQVSNDLMDSFLDFDNNVQKLHNIPECQYKLAFSAVCMLYENRFPEEITFKYSIENEILIIKNNLRGNHYLIIGDEEEDISYGFVGTEIGQFETVHGNFQKLGDLVTKFINA